MVLSINKLVQTQLIIALNGEIEPKIRGVLARRKARHVCRILMLAKTVDTTTKEMLPAGCFQVFESGAEIALVLNHFAYRIGQRFGVKVCRDESSANRKRWCFTANVLI